MTQLRVLLVNGSLYGGGAERVITTLAHHLRSQGHQVTTAVVHAGGELLVQMERDGFDVITVGRNNTGSSASAIRKAIADRNVQVVHSHDLRALVDVTLCRLRLSRVAHVHSFHFGNYPYVPWKQLWMERAAARFPDALVAVGHAQREAVSRALGLPSRRLQTVWNGVDYESEPDWSGIDRQSTVPRVGSVSTFGEQKGLTTLLLAARQLKDRQVQFHLVLVGDGPLRAALEALTRDLGLSQHVSFTGWRPDAARTLIPTFDVFVQSSHWEAMSIVILEAMAARRPIVATTVGENPTVLESGVSAVLVPPREATALAAGLERVLRDRLLQKSLAARAREAYERLFTGRAMTERHVALYSDVVARRTGSRT